MIINKQFENIKVKIFYDIKYDGLACDDEVCEEEVTVENLNALLLYLGDYGINKIKEEHEYADSIIVSGISIQTEKEEGVRGQMNLYKDRKFHGWVTAEVNNEDVDNRLLNNLRHIKHAVDNALEGYPIKY